MKLKIKILFVSVAIAFFLLGGYCYCEYRQTVIEQIAKDTFVKAVDEEAYKRIPDVKMTVGFSGGNMLRKDKASEYIYWYNKSGKRKYKIDPEKHWKNVTMDSDVRTLHSCAFEGSPL